MGGHFAEGPRSKRRLLVLYDAGYLVLYGVGNWVDLVHESALGFWAMMLINLLYDAGYSI